LPAIVELKEEVKQEEGLNLRGTDSKIKVFQQQLKGPQLMSRRESKLSAEDSTQL
jgi:hypothetical protein